VEISIDILIEVLEKPSINADNQVVVPISVGNDWRMQNMRAIFK
jgi:hypothetical protein